MQESAWVAIATFQLKAAAHPAFCGAFERGSEGAQRIARSNRLGLRGLVFLKKKKEKKELAVAGFRSVR